MNNDTGQRSLEERQVLALERIAKALENKNQPEGDELASYPLARFASFDWSTIGATVLERDEFGVSVIRTSNGRIAKRRSNEKYGQDVWFSYSTGKDEDDKNTYRRVVEFRTLSAPEPLGRKTEAAIQKSATGSSDDEAVKAARLAQIAAQQAETARQFERERDAKAKAEAEKDPNFAGRAAAAREREAARIQGRNWAASVVGLLPVIEQRETIKAVYAKLEKELMVRTAGVTPYSTAPASLAEAIARARDMAASLDKLAADDIEAAKLAAGNKS